MNILVELARYNIIETPRLLLRPLRIQDAEDMYEYASKPENLIFIFPPHKNLAETELSLARNFMEKPLGKWAIVLKDERKMIGTIDFIKLNHKEKSATIGYVINKDYWGCGLMTEALKNLIDFSFRKFGLTSLDLVADVRNLASKRVAEKAQMKKIREYKSSNKYTKEIVLFSEYRIERADYLKENE
ncbi:GNAT family N-acetyltransferase [Streptococcaceae bacterium ESL0729]|nr:GNAT family N-acetyltransferase [Streptococcaceae bacterium ESL0729]